MKTAKIPPVDVEPEFKAEIDAVLAEGESLAQFVEDALRAAVKRRRDVSEFTARGLRLPGDTQVSADHADSDGVLDGLQRQLDAAFASLGKKRI